MPRGYTCRASPTAAPASFSSACGWRLPGPRACRSTAIQACSQASRRARTASCSSPISSTVRCSSGTGGKARLYPARSVAPLVGMMRRAGVSLLFHVFDSAGHDVSWWPDERPRFQEFVATHVRQAHPERLSWETERTDRYNRIRWLVIDRLGVRASDVQLEDVNTFGPSPEQAITLYTREHASGRVDVARSGNTFEARTRGVREFTLLLSPDVVDFARPVQVVVNGRTVHSGVIRKDVAALLRWAARDNDSTMLYGAELKISVP